MIIIMMMMITLASQPYSFKYDDALAFTTILTAHESSPAYPSLPCRPCPFLLRTRHTRHPSPPFIKQLIYRPLPLA